MKRALVAVVVFCAASLHADNLLLKSGESIEGFYQAEESGVVTFVRISGERITVPSEEVESLEFSQSGIPVCYTTRTSGEKKCEALLASVSSDYVIVAEGKSRRSVRKIPRDDMVAYEVRKVADYQKIIPYLAMDKKAVVTTTAQTKVAGKVIDVAPEGVIIRDGNGNNITIPESQIVSADVSMVVVPFRWLDPNNLIIGGPQIASGRTIMGRSLRYSFIGMWTGFVYEYYLASTMTKKAQGDLTVMLFNNQSYFKEFQRHQANQRYLALTAGGLYVFHWFDLYRHREDTASVLDVQLAAAPVPDLTVRPPEPSLALFWSYRF